MESISPVTRRQSVTNRLDDYFEITKRGSTLNRELRGGLVLFCACSYILMVNPRILLLAGIDPHDSTRSTAIAAGVGTLFAGFVTNLPLLIAPGMGLNTLFACEMMVTQKLSYNEAIGVTFLSFLILSVFAFSGFAIHFLKLMPLCLKKAVIIGIGLFQSFIGLYTLKIIVPGTLTPLEFHSVTQPEQLVAIFTLIITALCMSFGSDAAVLYGTCIGCITYYFFIGDADLGEAAMGFQGGLPLQEFTTMIFSLSWSTVINIFSIICVSIADLGGVLMGFALQAPELADEKTGMLRDANKILSCVSCIGLLNSVLGSSPPVCFMESVVAFSSGARTGIPAIVCAVLFLSTLLVTDLISLVPSCVGSVVLILIGALMMQGSTAGIKWYQINEALPAWMTMMGIGYTCSICIGLGFGVGFYIALNLLPWCLHQMTSRNGKVEESEYESSPAISMQMPYQKDNLTTAFLPLI